MPPGRSKDIAEPVFVVHGLVHAVAALEAAAAAEQPVVLLSAPHAGGYAGPGWFRELVIAARAAVPAARCRAFLDCGDEAGATLAALRAGVEGVIFTGRADVARRLADIAARHGASFATTRRDALCDLADDFFAAPDELRERCAAALIEAARQATRS